MVSPPVHQILIKLLLFLDKILVELHEIIVDLQHQKLRWKHFCSILDSKMRIVTRWYTFGTTPYKRFTSQNMMERCQKIGFSVATCRFKGSSDQSHFIFEINVGKSRIRHTTTLKYNVEFLNQFKID